MAMPFEAMERGGAMAPLLAQVRLCQTSWTEVLTVNVQVLRIYSLLSFHWSIHVKLLVSFQQGLRLRNEVLVIAGDVIGAALNRSDGTISYYKNGIDLGVAFRNVTEQRLFPCVGMQTHEEEVGPSQDDLVSFISSIS